MYRNFHIATYPHAEYLYYADLDTVEEAIRYFQKRLPLTKVYLETHRGMYDIEESKMRAVKELFHRYGIETGGAIAPTLSIPGHEKNTLYDVICYQDPVYRKAFLDIVRYTASLFDEIILDDFFFTSCKCPLCIDARGDRTWAEYRTDLMLQVSRDMKAAAADVNPGCRLIIKYPNWYESYRQCGYAPDLQKDVFDFVYTGTEARNPKYDPQHVQRYLSYSSFRRITGIVPGRNLGAWIDEGGSNNHINTWVEQAALSLFAGAKVLIACRDWMSFRYPTLTECPLQPVLGQQLKRIDSLLDKTGTPIGVSVYEPLEGSGEGQLINYLGMLGIPFEPSAVFREDAPVIFLTASAAADPQILTKLKSYVRNGGHAVATPAFVEAMSDRGIDEITNAQITNRRASAELFIADGYHRNQCIYCESREPVTFPVYTCSGGAWQAVSMVTEEAGFSILTEEFYGDGSFLILNIPDDYSQLYRLPEAVVAEIAAVLTRGLFVSLSAAPKYSLFVYDNQTFGLLSYRPHAGEVDISIRLEDASGIRDLETGEVFAPLTVDMHPEKRFDSAKIPEALTEQHYKVSIENGEFRFFEVLRKEHA